MHAALLPTDKCWLHTHTHIHTPVFLASRFSTKRTSKEVEEKDLKFRHVLSVMKTSTATECSMQRGRDGTCGAV